MNSIEERFPDLLGEYTVATSSGTDYYCRLIVPAKVWMQVQMGLTAEIGYGNFKNEVSARHLTDPEYKSALIRFWSIHYDLQSKLHRGGGFNSWDDSDE